MTQTQARLAQSLISLIYDYEIETQYDLEAAYEIEMDGITDEVVINAVKSELGM